MMQLVTWQKKVTDKGHYYEVQVSTVFSTLELTLQLDVPVRSSLL